MAYGDNENDDDNNNSGDGWSAITENTMTMLTNEDNSDFLKIRTHKGHFFAFRFIDRRLKAPISGEDVVQILSPIGLD